MKSTEFITNRIKQQWKPGKNLYNISDLHNIEESEVAKTYVEIFAAQPAEKKRLSVRDAASGKSFTVNLDIKYDPDAEFQYFTSKEVSCDGTLVFLVDMEREIFNKICALETWSSAAPSMDGTYPEYNVTYIVGNFVTSTHVDNKYATKDKPWCNCHYICFLPIRIDVEPVTESTDDKKVYANKEFEPKETFDHACNRLFAKQLAVNEPVPVEALKIVSSSSNSENNKLPDGFIEMDYIRSNGEDYDYIDTGIHPDNNSIHLEPRVIGRRDSNGNIVSEKILCYDVVMNQNNK